MALRPKPPKSDTDKKAERDAAQQDVFLREVDDALRQDQMTDMFRRYGLPVFGLVAAVLLGLGGYLWWQHSQKQAAEQRGEELVMALDQLEAGNLATADKQLAPIAEDGAAASATAAKLARAGIALTQNRREEAIRIYAEVAADKDAPQPFRDLATVREVAAGFDKMKPQEVVDRLKPLAVPGNPWFGPAGELVGIAYLELGKEDLAGPLFAKIARDEDTPDSLRARTRQLAGLLGVDAIDDPKMAAGDAPDAAAPSQQ
ncbi:MAG: tetratricopeptide repeat protein [Novosphingobium sp.]|nr:tetratricopeptide repeat protein [Novosphingobium sp.]